MPKVCLAAVGIYFGTTNIPPSRGATGFQATKFRNAPIVDVSKNANLEEIAQEVSQLAFSGGVPGCDFFRMELTEGGFIRSVAANYTQPPSTRRPAGFYRMGDHSVLEGQAKINPVLAWQYYIYAPTADGILQKQADGLTRNAKVPIRELEENDLVILRCVLIAGGPVDFYPRIDLGQPAQLA